MATPGRQTLGLNIPDKDRPKPRPPDTPGTITPKPERPYKPHKPRAAVPGRDTWYVSAKLWERWLAVCPKGTDPRTQIYSRVAGLIRQMERAKAEGGNQVSLNLRVADAALGPRLGRIADSLDQSPSELAERLLNEGLDALEGAACPTPGKSTG